MTIAKQPAFVQWITQRLTTRRPQETLTQLILASTPLPEIADFLRSTWHADLVLILRQLDETTAEIMTCVPSDVQMPSMLNVKSIDSALLQKQPIYMADYPTAVNASPFITATGIQSAMELPVGTGAAVMVGWREPQSFPPAQRQRLEAFSTEIAYAVQTAQTTRRLRTLESQWNTIMGTMPQAAIFLNPDGTRSYINRAASDMLHVPAGYIEPTRVAQAMRLLRQQAINATQIEEESMRLFSSPTGSIRDWLWEYSHPAPHTLSVTVIPTTIGDTKGWLWLIEDVTARKQVEAQKIELAVEKERAHILSDFIRDAGHEFRTPLTVLNTGLYLMERMKDDDQRHERIAVLQHQVDDISHLLDDLIEMTQLDSRDTVPTATTLPAILLHDVRSAWQHAAVQRGLTVRLELLEPEPLPTLTLNAELMQRALDCLMQNALDYTPAGGTITLCGYRSASGIQIAVHDTGIGIPAGDLERIFDRFYRVDKARTRRGSGLGLAIARRIIELHGGTLTAESTAGAGSTFKVNLPL